MNKEFVKYLKCPKTGSDLRLFVKEEADNGLVKSGFLISFDKKHRYEILNYIPRFVSKEYYSSSFGYEWKKWPKVQFESENIGKVMQGHTLRMFDEITGFNEDEVRGKMIVEFGCGSGRFLDIVQRGGGLAVGIDMSMAVESARENFRDNKNVLIIQGDILNPPFKNNCFDHGYTIGVLHHTNNPAKGLQELSSLVKPGGKIACCVYPKNEFYNYFSVFMLRKIHFAISNTLGVNIARIFSVGYSYISAFIFFYLVSLLRIIPYLGERVVGVICKYLLVVIDVPDVHWRILDTFDAITPRYASTHDFEEVRKWFIKSGIDFNRKTNWCSTSLIGFKH